MSYDQQYIADRLAIKDRLALLSRGIDRGDRDLIASCYVADSWDDHGGFKGTGAQFADYICGGSPISGTARSMLHVLGQQLFDIDGDEAFVETAYSFDMVNAAGNLVHSAGRYVDYLVRVQGSWLIKFRRVIPEWTGEVTGTEYAPAEDRVRPARDRSDAVYDRRKWFE